MRWDAKITDTAKISVEVRWILIDRVDSILNELKLLRQRAVGYASPESIGVLASQISLPSPTKDECEALGDSVGSCSSSFQLLPQVVIAEEQESILEALLGNHGATDSDEQEIFGGLDETWFQNLDGVTEHLGDLDPVLYWDSVCQETDGDDSPNQLRNLGSLCSKDLQPDMDEGDTKESTQYAQGPNDSSLFDSEEANAATPLVSNTDGRQKNRQSRHFRTYGHSLLTPWRESFPARLQAYLDELDAAREIALSSFDLSPYDDCALDDASPYDYIDTDTSTESDSFCSVQSAARELLQYLHAACPPSYPVDAEQLIQLQAYMQQVARFRAYLAKSLLDVRNALNRREERYRMREANGNITLMMKSHGETSPLAKSMSVDEEWVEEDGWSSPVMMEAECIAFQKVGYKADKVKW